MLPEILNKKQSTEGYRLGLFGNHLRQWDTPEDALRECGEWTELQFMIRWRGRGSGGVAKETNAVLVDSDWKDLLQQGHSPKDLYVSERCPDHKLIFQGEFVERPECGGYALHWSQIKEVQRKALAIHSDHAHGPGALLLCKQFMDTDSYEDLRSLLDLYPLHVVEFSCFTVRLGNLRRNTIFWEVRKF